MTTLFVKPFVLFSTLLFVIVSLHKTNAETNNNSSAITWTHTLSIDQGFELKWTYDDPEWLTMEMSAPATGYVAIGFSPNGGMKDSDIILGWVDSTGQAHIKDMYGIGNTKPKEDKVQNCELLSGEESDNITTIRFRRKWNTCDDEHDRQIGEETIRLIWAYNQKDPELADDDGVFRPPYHFALRGSRRAYLRTPAQQTQLPDDYPEKFPNVKHWDVRMENNNISAEDDIYFCQIAKFPALKTKHQMIGFRPLLTQENKYNIHHMMMYECHVPSNDGTTENIFEKHAGNPGGRCYTPNMPPEWSKYCVDVPILWTSGSEGTMLPENVGLPLGEEHDGTTYFMFEIHYDNPQLKSFLDSSGFRLFYTDNLRQNDAGSIAVGNKLSPMHMIPPSLNSFTTAGFCPSECTSQAIPSMGITAITVLLHAHLAGRKIILRHFRDGKELEPIAQDNHYDYNYQQARILKTTRQILPGDELMTVCEFDTTSRTTPAFGGLGTRDEMCMSFIYYYPKIQFAECKTLVEYNSFLNGLGVTEAEGDILSEINMPYVPKDGQETEYADSPFYLKNSTYEHPLNALDVLHIVKPTHLSGTTVGALIRNFNWSDAEAGKRTEQQWMTGQQYAFCTGPNKKRIPLKNYAIKLPYGPYEAPKEDKCSG